MPLASALGGGSRNFGPRVPAEPLRGEGEIDPKVVMAVTFLADAFSFKISRMSSIFLLLEEIW